MKLNLFIFTFFLSLTLYSQNIDNTIGAKNTDLMKTVIVSNGEKYPNVYVDGLKLNLEERRKLSQDCKKCQLNYINDTTVYIKTRFSYIINNTFYSNKEKKDILDSIAQFNSSIIINFYNKKQAKEKFNICSKEGIVEIVKY